MRNQYMTWSVDDLNDEWYFIDALNKEWQAKIAKAYGSGKVEEMFVGWRKVEVERRLLLDALAAAGEHV